MASSSLTDRERCVRKLRKKLRQIEHLELLDRELNEEEASKIDSKSSIRKEIGELIKAMKRKSTEEANVGSSDESAAAKNGDLGGSSKRVCVSSKSRPSPSSLNQEEQLEISCIPTLRGESSGVAPSPPTPAPTPAPTPDAEVTSSSAPASQDSEEDGGASAFVQVKVSTPAKKLKKKFNKLAWRQKSLIVYELSGHDDLVLSSAIDVERDVAVTASRDTRVLAWKLSTRELRVSLRGHTGPVTAVAILPRTVSNGVLALPEAAVVGVSASLDCSIKVWNITKGELVKSIYTYNGIKVLSYCPALQSAVTGTDGGKLELFRLSDGTNLHSVRAHEDAITTLDLCGTLLATGCRDGTIRVWEVLGDGSDGGGGAGQLRCLYASSGAARGAAREDGGHGAAAPQHLRCVLSLKLIPSTGSLVYGDSGCNIKILDWRGDGRLRKLPNHTSEMGFTDCLSLCGDLLLASSYDLDSGLGHVNAFHLRGGGDDVPTYVCSWTDEETGRVFSMAGVQTGEAEVALLTTGREVKLWKTVRGHLPDEDALLVRPSVLPLYSKEVVDSGSSDSEMSSVDESDGERGSNRSSAADVRGTRLTQDVADGGWRCCIL